MVVFLRFNFYIENNLVNATKLSDFLPPLMRVRYVRDMKKLKNIFLAWYRNWFWVDLLAFGSGTLLTMLYIKYGNNLSPRLEAYKDIWPNISTEIIGVWVSVRVIDSIIRNRDERHNVRDRVVANLNFIMKICQDLLPDFYSWQFNDLKNEIIWFGEKKKAPKTSKQLKKYFSSEEQATIEEIFQIILTIEKLTNEAIIGGERFNQLSDSKIRYSGPEEIQSLIKLFRQSQNTESPGNPEVNHYLTVIEHKLKNEEYDTNLLTEIQGIAQSVSVHIKQLNELRLTIHSLENNLSRFRQRIAENTA